METCRAPILCIFHCVALQGKKKKVDIHAHIYQAGSRFTKRTRSYFRECLLVPSEQINHRVCIYIYRRKFSNSAT